MNAKPPTPHHHHHHHHHSTPLPVRPYISEHRSRAQNKHEVAFAWATREGDPMNIQQTVVTSRRSTSGERVRSLMAPHAKRNYYIRLLPIRRIIRISGSAVFFISAERVDVDYNDWRRLKKFAASRASVAITRRERRGRRSGTVG